MNISEELVEEIQQTLTEGEFSSRWTIIETYHQVGTLINQVKANKTEVLHAIAPRVNRSVRSLWYASKFAEVFPRLDALPEGKSVSWNKIIVNYLADGKKEPKECEHKDTKNIVVCVDCKSRIKG